MNINTFSAVRRAGTPQVFHKLRHARAPQDVPQSQQYGGSGKRKRSYLECGAFSPGRPLLPEQMAYGGNVQIIISSVVNIGKMFLIGGSWFRRLYRNNEGTAAAIIRFFARRKTMRTLVAIRASERHETS